MASGDFFQNMKQKVRTVYNNFFYDGQEAPAPAPMQDEQPVMEQPPMTNEGYQPLYQNTAYTVPQPGVYQAEPQGNYYQQPIAPPAHYTAPQVDRQAQPRNRRMQQHMQQNDARSNVVDFGAYQQQGHFQQPVQQPVQQAPAQMAESAPVPAEGTLSTRVINARGMADCRSAITLLREGDAVLIVLENITDPSEMRRLVDTLSGACYSLTASITKVSRYGVYLLSPQHMAVYTDQATNQMNGAPVRARAYPAAGGQPQYAAPQQPQYVPQPQYAQQPQYAPAQPQYVPQQSFTQRSAAPETAAPSFYARPAAQSAQTPDFSARPAATGYTPDEFDAANE